MIASGVRTYREMECKVYTANNETTINKMLSIKLNILFGLPLLGP